MSIKTTTTSTGISLGSAIAVAISWSMYKSVLWAIIHGFLGWFYIILCDFVMILDEFHVIV